MTCVRCNQIRFQSLNAFGAMRENFKRFSVATGAAIASRVPNCRLAGPSPRIPRIPVQYLLLWHCLLIEFMYKISKQKFVCLKGGEMWRKEVCIRWDFEEKATHVCDWNQFWQSLPYHPSHFLATFSQLLFGVSPFYQGHFKTICSLNFETCKVF